MSEKENLDAVPVDLVEDEVIVPEEKAEKIAEAIKETAKPVEAKAEETAITLPKEPKTGNGMATVPGGAIGSTKVTNPEPKAKVEKPKKTKEETIAIHSTRNVTWQGVGKVYIGYNIVTKEQADKWLTRNHTRLATPEEIAQEFGL